MYGNYIRMNEQFIDEKKRQMDTQVPRKTLIRAQLNINAEIINKWEQQPQMLWYKTIMEQLIFKIKDSKFTFIRVQTACINNVSW